MSGPGANGAKQRARVYQVDKATYQSGGIQRKGLVDVDKKSPPGAEKGLDRAPCPE